MLSRMFNAAKVDGRYIDDEDLILGRGLEARPILIYVRARRLGFGNHECRSSHIQRHSVFRRERSSAFLCSTSWTTYRSTDVKGVTKRAPLICGKLRLWYWCV